MKITVLDRPAEEIETTWEGVTRQRLQQWCVFEIDGLPTTFQVTSDRDKPLKPGEYTLDPKSFGTERGRLTMMRPILVPVKTRAPAPAPARPAA